MQLSIDVKFRAFGVTFGEIKDSVPIDSLIQPLAASVLALVSQKAPEAAPLLSGLDVTSLLSELNIPSGVLYNDHGIELQFTN
jgi:hypothetical protein